MALTRREFLSVAASATLPFPHSVDRRAWLVRTAPEARESVLGFRNALPLEREASGQATLFVFPGIVDVSNVSQDIRTHLQGGATVVVETGVGFAGPAERDLHRRSLRAGLGINLHAPLDLWSGRTRGGVPYIEYEWPTRASVRDFSRVVPVADQPGEVIGWAGNIPVALKRRVGKGTLIYLGSPLGPALWAGDLQARRWLQRVFAS